ncbi:hypothetical protein C8J42_1081, partial [Sphingomonas sp. PP-CE-1A-559]
MGRKADRPLIVRQAAITDIKPLNAEPWALGYLVPEQCRGR